MIDKNTKNTLLARLVIFLAFPAVLFGQVENTQKKNLQDDYDVKFYHLKLNVSDSSTYISGSTLIVLQSLNSSLQDILLDFSGLLQTDSVLLNGNHVNYTRGNNQLQVHSSQPVSAGQISNLEVFYHGLGKNTTELSGIYNKYVSAQNKHVTWTLSEPFSALYWFPCKQVLSDKADSVYIFLSTDNNLKAGSNGLLKASVPLPGNRVRYEWKSSYPIAYYLISFTVCDYIDYSIYLKNEDGSDSLLIQNYIYNDINYLQQNKAHIDQTADLIKLYSKLFGEYPFYKEKYGHCVAPFGGGMEHQTMTTLVNFSFSLVSHELAHQWFGDHVTCSSWQDIWINEGFASYVEYIAEQNLNSQTAADQWIEYCNDYVRSSPGGSVYIPIEGMDDENRIFDYRLSYKKGASIIHMLRQEINNDELFFSCLAGFLSTYGNGNATGEMFKNYIEERTGKDFDQFFQQWYYGQGFPVHTIRWSQEGDSLLISSFQTTSAPSSTPFFNVLLEFAIKSNGKDTVLSFRQTASYNEWKTYLPGNISSFKADPKHWLLIDLSDINTVPEIVTNEGFRIIPNPARERITVKFDNPVGKYSLYLATANGGIVTSIQSESSHENLDVHSLPPGIYFVIVRTEKEMLKGKFIIN